MDPTRILFPEVYEKKFDLPKFKSLSTFEARSAEDPTVFAYLMLGKKLYDYQDLTCSVARNNQFTVIVKARQLGFTELFAVYSLWNMWYNKKPVGMAKRTSIGFISKDDSAAGKLPDKIRDLLHEGDKHIYQLFGVKEYFSSQIGDKNNTEVVTISNVFGDSMLSSYPPTQKAIGESFSILIIDEAALLNCPNPKSWYGKISPTTAKTGGSIIISSTPRGHDDFFYPLVDPQDKKSTHTFYRLCFPYSISSDKDYIKAVEVEKTVKDEVDFRQEYCCDFTITSSKFFKQASIEKCINNQIANKDWSRVECVCGVDVGIANSNTVVTLSAVDKETDKITVFYFYRFPLGTDNNVLIPFVINLEKRFKIVKYIVDHSAPANTVNNMLIRMGRHVKLFDFHSEKLPYYSMFRDYMDKGDLQYIDNKDFIKELYELEEEESKTGKIMIHKTSTGFDDMIASAIMSCSQFLKPKSQFRVIKQNENIEGDLNDPKVFKQELFKETIHPTQKRGYSGVRESEYIPEASFNGYGEQ